MYFWWLLLVFDTAAEELASRSASDERPNSAGAWRGIFHKRKYGNVKVRVQIKRVTANAIRAVALDPSDTYLFAGGADDKKVKMWDVSWITQGNRDLEPETTTTTTTKWVAKTLRQQLRDIRLHKIKGSLHPDYRNPFDGEKEVSVQVSPGMESPKKELPANQITVPLLGEFSPGFRVSALVVSPSQPESTYTMQKNGIVFIGGDSGEVMGYDADDLVRQFGSDAALESIQDESGAGGEPNPAANPDEESLVEESKEPKDKKTGFTPTPLFTLKQGVKVNQLILSSDYRMLCGCGTYLSLVDRLFSDQEPVEDKAGSTNASGSSYLQRRLNPDKGENDTFSMPQRGTNRTHVNMADPRNGWASCWDVSRFTLGNLSTALEEGPPERIFRAKRGDETFAVAFADDDASLVIGGDDRKVRKYSINTQTELKEYNTTSEVLSLAVNERKPNIIYAGLRDGDFLALEMPLDDRKFGATKLFNISHGQQVDALKYYNYKDTTDILFSAGWRGSAENAPGGTGESQQYELPEAEDDTKKADKLKKPPPGDNPGRITVWSLQQRDNPEELSFMSMNGMSWVNTLCMARSKNFMVSGGNDGSIVFWNPGEANLGKLAAIAKYKNGKWEEAGRVEIIGPQKRYSKSPILPKVDPNTPEDRHLRNGQSKALAKKSLGITPPDVLAARMTKEGPL